MTNNPNNPLSASGFLHIKITLLCLFFAFSARLPFPAFCAPEMNLPERGIAEIIGLYVGVWRYPEWVKARQFSAQMIGSYIVQNPLGMDEIKDIDWDMLCENSAPWAVDMILNNLDKISDYYFLARNEDERAIALIDSVIARNEATPQNFRDGNSELFELHHMISANPKRIDFLRQHPQFIDPTYLMWNPAAKDLIDERKIPICIDALRVNDAPWAAELLLRNTAEVKYLCANENPRIVAYILSRPPELISWDRWSRNPAAIDHLRANPDKVTAAIYANPAVMTLAPPDGLVDLLMEL